MTRERCSWTSAAAVGVSASLRCIWAVAADKSYNVIRPSKHPPFLVAARTTSGEGEMMIEGLPTVTVAGGDLIIVQNHRLMQYRRSRGVWRFWWFEFVADDLLGLALNEPFNVKPTKDELQGFQTCFNLLSNPGPLSAAMASSMFSTMLQGWIMRWRELHSPPHPQQLIVDQAISRMRANLENPVSVEHFAQQAGLSSRRFRQVFQQITGNSPKRHYDLLRLTMAAHRLGQGRSVTQTSQELGYSSPYHLSKAFKGCFGKAPSLQGEAGAIAR